MCICLVNGHWTCSLASIWIREVFNDPWGQDRTQLSRWMATILIFYWIPWLVSYRNWWNCCSRPQFSIVLSGDPSSVMSSIFWFFMPLRRISFLGSCVEVAGARSALPAMWWPHPFNFKLLEKLYVYNSLQKSMRLKPFGRNLRSYLLHPHGRLALCWCFKALKSPGPKSRVTQMQRRACLVTEWIHGFKSPPVNFETVRFWMISTISQFLAGKVTPRHDIALLFCAHGSIRATYHVSHQATSEASSKVEEEAVCVWVVKICGSGASYHIHAISSPEAETVEVEGLVMKSMERSALWDSIGFIAFFWPKAVPCMVFFFPFTNRCTDFALKILEVSSGILTTCMFWQIRQERTTKPTTVKLRLGES